MTRKAAAVAYLKLLSHVYLEELRNTIIYDA